MENLEKFIDIAIAEARTSLKQGNSGFGAVIIQDNNVIAKSHDTDTTSNDPTAHAELSAIRLAAQKTKGDLSYCMLVCTHEPCLMCFHNHSLVRDYADSFWLLNSRLHRARKEADRHSLHGNISSVREINRGIGWNKKRRMRSPL
jgi:cytidine deaminase